MRRILIYSGLILTGAIILGVTAWTVRFLDAGGAEKIGTVTYLWAM